MRTMWVVVVVLACVLGGCTSRSAPGGGGLPDSIRTVRLNVDAGGTVELEGKADTASLSVSYDGPQPDDETYSVDGDVLTLNGCGLRCAAHYEITLPGDVDVRGAVENGDLSLTAVTGIDVTSDNATVTLADLDTGDVRVRTDNGTITGDDLRTDSIEATTENGLIDLAVARPQNITAETRNGDIDLTVPESSYHVSTTTVHGDVDVAVQDQPNGQYTLDLTTENGGIFVETA